MESVRRFLNLTWFLRVVLSAENDPFEKFHVDWEASWVPCGPAFGLRTWRDPGPDVIKHGGCRVN